MRPSNTSSLGYLQADTKYVTPELSGLPFTCYESAFIDIHSRYKGAWIVPILDESASIMTLKWVMKSFPFKILYVQTDNGLEYQSSFNRACEEVGIRHYYNHKKSPNENAVIERSFRTDQDEFFFFRLKEPVKSIDDLNGKYQEFLHWYNTRRPHFGLNFQTPLQVIQGVYQKS